MVSTVRLVVFDCDGTLIDSQHAIVAAMERAFVACGLAQPDPAAVRHVVGLSLVRAIAELLPESEPPHWAKIAEAYKEAFVHIRAQGEHQEPLYPGIRDLLDELDAASHLLAVATGKSWRGLKATLQRHGLEDHFVSLQTADHHASKPDPAMLLAAMAEAGVEPERTLMIGDTSYDMEMAVRARVTAIGVDWGYHAEPQLRAAGATAILRQPGDLHAVLEASAA